MKKGFIKNQLEKFWNQLLRALRNDKEFCISNEAMRPVIAIQMRKIRCLPFFQLQCLAKFIQFKWFQSSTCSFSKVVWERQGYGCFKCLRSDDLTQTFQAVICYLLAYCSTENVNPVDFLGKVLTLIQDDNLSKPKLLLVEL